MQKRFIPFVMFMFCLSCLCSTVFADGLRGHARPVIKEKVKNGPKPGFNHGPKPGFNHGPKPGFNNGPKPGFNNGPKLGFKHGPKPGFKYGPKEGTRVGQGFHKDLKDKKKFEEHHKKHWKEERKFDKHHKKHWKEERKFDRHHKKHRRNHRRFNEESMRRGSTTPINITVQEYDEEDESTGTEEMIKEAIGSIVNKVNESKADIVSTILKK